MLRVASYDIVFQEIPGEVTLALNIAGCPNRCPGCHSEHLQQPEGEVLDEALLDGLLLTYGDSVTCVCFMGGDGEPAEVERLAKIIRRQGASLPRSTACPIGPGLDPGVGSGLDPKPGPGLDPELDPAPNTSVHNPTSGISPATTCDTQPGPSLKTAWYSGRESIPVGVDATNFDYIKLGPYIERLGGLCSPTTNQRLYKVDAGALIDITDAFAGR